MRSDSILTFFNEHQRAALRHRSQPLIMTAGSVLFQRYAPADAMYVLKKGKVSVFRLMPNGDEKVFRVFLPGETIADMVMFMVPRCYQMTARVEQHSELTVIRFDDVLAMIHGSPEISADIMTYMSNRLSQLMNRVDILTQVNANQRLVMTLAQLYRQQLPQCRNLCLTTTKRVLAAQLGMTPETLSRALRKLKSDGFLIESGTHLILNHIPELCRSVDLTPDIFGPSVTAPPVS